MDHKNITSMKSYNDKNSVEVFGVLVDSRKMEVILEEIFKYLSQKEENDRLKLNVGVKPLTIYTPNPEILMFARRYNYYKEILNNGSVTIPDGIGVVLASRLLTTHSIPQRIAGADFVAKLIDLAFKQAFTAGFIGGFSGVALDALECLKREQAQIRGWSLEVGSWRVEDGKLKLLDELGREKGEKETGNYIISLAKYIKKTETDMVFVGLGHPKQELFIDMVKDQLVKMGYKRPIVLMAVGGTFDFISGRVKRAPLWLRKINLEWLYRLIKEPSRTARQLVLPQFLFFLSLEYIQLIIKNVKRSKEKIPTSRVII